MAGLGKTNKFPKGKLREDDEGELKFAIGIHEEKVVIDFGTPVHWIGLDKNDAIALGQLLINKGESL